MNWKREAVEKLKEYEARRRALGNIPEELKRLEAAFDGVHSAITGTIPIQGGGGEKDKALLSNIALREELRSTYATAQSWVKVVNSGLAVLTDEERNILDKFYINPIKGNVDRLCEELHLEKTRVYELRNNALKKFTLALYGVTET